MRKAVVGGLGVLAIAILVVTLAPAIRGQVRERPVPPPVDFGVFGGPGGRLGVSVRDPRTEELSAAKITQAGGVFIQDVRDGSAAARAGLREGDIVVEFDGERVRSARHFSRLVLETPAGRTVKATVVRDGSRQTLDVTPEDDRVTVAIPDVQRELERGLRALPDFDFDFELPREIIAPRNRFGMSLTPLSDQLASYFGVKNGALVSSVAADSPAAQAGIKAGDVITAVAGRAVYTPRDFNTRLREAEPGAVDVAVVRDKKEMTFTLTVPEPRRRLRQI
jgi:serine protease Do